MARVQDWQKDISEGVKRENWSISGPSCIVKVLPSGITVPTLGGYITLGRYLVGKTPNEIELALGLPNGHLRSGARIYRFRRVPMQHEYEYELTAHYPGGLAFNPAHGDPSYLPGQHGIHQWKIKPGILIPVDEVNLLDLSPGQRLTYEWLVRVN